MQYAMLQGADGENRIVKADGSELGSNDVTQRVLHILPCLLVPFESLRGMDREEIELKITCSHGVDLVPAGGIVIRQPYPNARYFVGGSVDIRNGWVVPFPDSINSFDLTFSWTIYRPWRAGLNADEWEVRHIIHVTLFPGSGNTYTLDSRCWSHLPQASKLLGQRTPISILGHPDEEDDLFDNRDIVKKSWLSYGENEAVVGRYIEECYGIPGIKFDQAYSIDAHQDEQLHEVKQTTSFTQGNEVHRKNASVEFPAKLFIEAVRLARAIDFGKDSAFAQSILGIQGGAEQHPAIKLLNEWWMKNSPVKSDYSVGYAIPFVRVRDDNEYWCAYHEVPNTPMEAFLTIANTQARIGDVVLLQFYASHIHYKGDNDGVHIILADGTPYMTIGIEAEELYSGQYDETLNSLEALFYFPSRFPLAWELLKTL